MPAFHEPVFFAQHRVAIERPVLHEIGEQPALAPLLMDAASLVDGFAGCIATERRGVLDNAAYRRAKRNFSRAQTRTARFAASSIQAKSPSLDGAP